MRKRKTNDGDHISAGQWSRGRLNGEGLSCYAKNKESNPYLGIYSENTFKEKSERLNKLGFKGFNEEFREN